MTNLYRQDSGGEGRERGTARGSTGGGSVHSHICDRAAHALISLVATQTCCTRDKTDTHIQHQAHQYKNPGLMPSFNFVRYTHIKGEVDGGYMGLLCTIFQVPVNVCLFLNFYCSEVDLQCFVSFRRTAKRICYTYIQFFRFFSNIGHYRVLSSVPFAIQ